MPSVRVVQEKGGKDVCPLCRAVLGNGRGPTRRQPVFSPVKGVFLWFCPDCQGIWRVDRKSVV